MVYGTTSERRNNLSQIAIGANQGRTILDRRLSNQDIARLVVKAFVFGLQLPKPIQHLLEVSASVVPASLIPTGPFDVPCQT
jgi:hypothetical protein